MNKQYTISINPDGKEVISYEENGYLISFMADPSNSDYQAYLKSLEEDTISQEYGLALEAVLKAARDEIGYKEGANNANKFAKIAGHANNQPWCATFI